MKKAKKEPKQRSRTSLSSRSRDRKVQEILKNLDLDDDDDESYSLNPNAPIFKNLQENLHKQLTKNHDDIDVQFREYKDKKKNLVEKRETIGYNLYNAQRNLANLNMKINMASKKIKENSEHRKKTEQMVKNQQHLLDQVNSNYSNAVSQYEHIRGELEKLNNAIREMEEENQNKISDAVIMRRIAYKAEENVKEKENEKQNQDFYIDNLMQRLDDMVNRVQKLEAQIQAQKEESKKAQLAIFQAECEENRMSFEREQLLKNWNSAMIGVKFRLITLERIQNAVEEQENQIIEIGIEIEMIKRMQKEQADNKEIQAKVLKRIEDKFANIEKKIEDIKIQKKKLANQSEILNNKIALKQHQLSALLDERLEAKTEFEKALASACLLNNQIHENEEKMKNRKDSNQARNIANLQNAAIPLKREVESKKAELLEFQNEKVRINLTKLTLDNQVLIYQNRLNALKKEIQDNEDRVSKYQQEQADNKSQIDKNLKFLDSLNKKYDQIHSQLSSNENSLNPLEEKLKEIKLQVEDISKKTECEQDQWLKMQSDFVQTCQDCELLDRSITEMNSKVVIMQRKVERSKLQLNEIKKENQKYQIHLKIYENEREKLNSQLNENNSEYPNICFDSNLIDILQGKEKEAAEIESQIEQKFQEKREIEDEQLDAERSIEVWERKIKLFEEMEEKFDKSENEKELQMMRNEVQRLEESLAKIKSQQRKIVEQMQNALRMRERVKNPDYEKDDQLINDGIQQLKEIKKNKDDDEILEESLAKIQLMRDEEMEINNKVKKDQENEEIENLENELIQVENEIRQQEKIIHDELKAQNELKPEMIEIDDVVNEFEKQQIEFKQMIKDQNRFKETLNSKLARLQLRDRFFNGKKIEGDPDVIANLDGIQKQMIELIMLLDRLTFDFPELSDKFIEIKDLLVFD